MLDVNAFRPGHQQADPAWGSAYTFIADWVGDFYDDDAIFSRHYSGIKGHLEALRTQVRAGQIRVENAPRSKRAAALNS